MEIQYPNYTYRAKLVNIVNGRTIDVDLDLGFNTIKRKRLRFAGKSDKPAEMDKEWLEELLPVDLVIKTVKDGHFLISAHVWFVEQTGWATVAITYVNDTLNDA